MAIRSWQLTRMASRLTVTSSSRPKSQIKRNLISVRVFTKKLKKINEEKARRKLEKKLMSAGVRLRRSLSHSVKRHRYTNSPGQSAHFCDCPPSDAATSLHLPLRENRQSTLNQKDPRVIVHDLFGIPMKSEFVVHSGKSFVRTVQGFYKPIYLVLMNTELYVYASHSATNHDDMYALGQNMGISVHALEPIPQTERLLQEGISW